jgi:hypothetical protein
MDIDKISCDGVSATNTEVQREGQFSSVIENMYGPNAFKHLKMMVQ